MNEIYLISAALLLVTFLTGLVRIVLGPTEADRMLSAQLFGTTGVAVLLLLALGMDRRPAVDVALVFALLAVVAAVAFVRRVREPQPATED
jgi:multicomponent Na+:H+ antiporter subunit F